MKNCTPSNKDIIFTDWSVFLTLFGYMFFIGWAFVLFFMAEYPFSEFGFYEWIEVIVYFPLAFILTVPLALWWCYVTRRTFKTGVIIEAKVTDHFGIKKGPYIGIRYSFNYDDKEFNQFTTQINRGVARGLWNSDSISVIFDPKREISFIYEIYCNENKNHN